MRGEVSLSMITITKIDKFMFTAILDGDSDFSENEDYFREDTLDLGYENESQRCSEELYNQHIKKLKKGKTLLSSIEAAVEEVMEYSTGGTQFIAGNWTYSGGYETSVTQVGDTFIVAWAYSSN